MAQEVRRDAAGRSRSHHTVWLDLPGGHTVALRYVSNADQLICLGDDGLAEVSAGPLSASLRGLACGPQVNADPQLGPIFRAFGVD